MHYPRISAHHVFVFLRKMFVRRVGIIEEEESWIDFGLRIVPVNKGDIVCFEYLHAMLSAKCYLS